MVTQARIQFEVSATGPDLQLKVSLDDHIIWEGVPGNETETVTYDFDDGKEQNHVLEFCMHGKIPDHTLINEQGTILQDRCIHITHVCFDEIELGHMLTEIAEYHHDHNGTTDAVVEKFYSVMGCNGRVKICFSTPIYLWLLEKM